MNRQALCLAVVAVALLGGCDFSPEKKEAHTPAPETAQVCLGRDYYLDHTREMQAKLEQCQVMPAALKAADCNCSAALTAALVDRPTNKNL